MRSRNEIIGEITYELVHNWGCIEALEYLKLINEIKIINQIHDLLYKNQGMDEERECDLTDDNFEIIQTIAEKFIKITLNDKSDDELEKILYLTTDRNIDWYYNDNYNSI